jgi:hypothetical protein
MQRNISRLGLTILLGEMANVTRVSLSVDYQVTSLASSSGLNNIIMQRSFDARSNPQFKMPLDIEVVRHNDLVRRHQVASLRL